MWGGGGGGGGVHYIERNGGSLKEGRNKHPLYNKQTKGQCHLPNVNHNV